MADDNKVSSALAIACDMRQAMDKLMYVSWPQKTLTIRERSLYQSAQTHLEAARIDIIKMQNSLAERSN